MENLINNQTIIARAEEKASLSARNKFEMNQAVKKNNALTLKLAEWSAIMSTVNPELYSLIFLLLLIFDAYLSQPIFIEIVASIVTWFVPVGIIILFTIKISDWFRSIIPSINEWEKYEAKKNYPGMLVEDFEKVYAKKRKNELTWGITATILLVLLITAISAYRVSLLERTFSVLDLLPPISYFFSIIFGCFLGYVVKKYFLKREIRKTFKLISKLQSELEFNTNMARAYFDKAKNEGEDVSIISANLKEAVERNLQWGVYLEEQEVNSHNFTIINEDNKPLEGLTLIGNSAAGNPTQIAVTDNMGKSTLYWQDNSNFLNFVIIDDNKYFGKFYKDKSTSIVLNNDMHQFKLLSVEG